MLSSAVELAASGIAEYTSICHQTVHSALFGPLLGALSLYIHVCDAVFVPTVCVFAREKQLILCLFLGSWSRGFVRLQDTRPFPEQDIRDITCVLDV